MIHLHPRGQVTLLEIDNPPVNATSQAVRQGLLDAIERLDADPAVGAIVIAGAGRTFTAGGDITEFGKPPLLPHLPDVITRIEACAKPVVVAWHGTALGGGCEIGLAATKRIIAPDGSVGLPEVKLGLMPGAGGTQRLPRLIGPVAALDLIASGRMVSAKEALALGLVDAMAAGHLRDEAIALAESLIGQPLERLSARPVPPADPVAWDAMVAKVKKDAKGRIAPLAAIQLVETARAEPFASGQPKERATFFDLMASPQSKALRHMFMAEREVARVPELAGIAPREIGHIGVIGAGTMGSGIAVAFLDAGFSVTLMEASEAALQAGLDRVNGLYLRSVKSGRIDETIRLERLSRLTPTTEIKALAETGLVIEAVFEDMAVKLDLLGRLGAALPAETIIATNTSYLDLEVMADALPHPERFIGLHFFSPAHVMKLLEIVRARRTSKEVLATGLAIGRRLRKIAVIAGVCDGFIGNRLLARYRAQCEFMLEEGALPQEIDAALEAFGFAMGPFAVQDLAGLDIAWARRKRLAATRDPAARDVPLVDRLCEAGRFGQKAGKGWYLYVDGKRQVDPEIDALVRSHAAGTGRAQRSFTTAEIQSRVLTTMVNEGAHILAEGIAARPLDIDLVLVNGYGFPNWRGGPMHYADETGLPRLLAEAEAIAARDGQAYAVAPLLRELAASGRTFASLNTPDR
ncbi:3-hydroxyacyl-CoA dehydrogenase NAD-binding domain-containing protein [Rhabdaerophilum sp. SD176]|uniref:3-hydroxyacyl-CoA dehydrogenase NAD-binding domain-containing protein n=1 Tax=Rhabdaerophilum sp. SD176 TaxID=2983548 RepID=UPI0024E03AF7|nr:3-hydroxyacyl-CoA dehydrogenase NAD-binding domain-containing protein [Rhabdaerophilum sp. SD176]